MFYVLGELLVSNGPFIGDAVEMKLQFVRCNRIDAFLRVTRKKTLNMLKIPRLGSFLHLPFA